jgi:o-succinylbenzoate synthase
MGLSYTVLTLGFVRPLATSSGTFKTRDTMILEWTVSDFPKVPLESPHSSGIDKHILLRSEVAPLPMPGFSSETLNDCIQWVEEHNAELVQYLNMAFERCLNENTDTHFVKLSDLRAFICQFFESESGVSPVPDNLPSLRFATDSLLYGLIMIWHNKRSGFLPSSGQTHLLKPIPVNALLTDIHQINALIETGFRTFKVKVGKTPNSELDQIISLRTKYPDIRIRLDANAGWTLEEAREWLPKFSMAGIEYLEQPVGREQLFTQLCELRGYGIPLAADESLRNTADLKRFNTPNLPDVAVIKPMIIKGMHETFTIISTCLHLGIKPVITSTLESGLTRRVLASIASLFELQEHAHGLGTGNLLNEDPFDDANLISGGYYHPGAEQ